MVWESSTNKAGLVYDDTGTLHIRVELLTLRDNFSLAGMIMFLFGD